MSKTFYIGSNEISHNLWRVSEDTFRIIEYNNFTPILVGSDYTIIDEVFMPAFDLLFKEEVEIFRIKIKRFSTDEIWNNYVELKIKNYINFENYEREAQTNKDIWQFKHHLIVSEKIKKELEKINNNQLCFLLGLGHWG